jgi:hypothetical protein
MPGPKENTHGSTVRGLTSSRDACSGLCRQQIAASDTETEQNLLKLGAAMVAPHDDPKVGPDAEESGIPAAYTYLGQSVDHDLTFDPESSLLQQQQWG